MSVDGRSHSELVALAPSTRAGTMSVECSDELCAESIAPSSTCAQLQSTTSLTIDSTASPLGAYGGGANAGFVSGAPMYTQTKPPCSCTGYVRCLTFCASALPAGSEGISTTLPSASIFQPWYRQRSPQSSLRPNTSDARRCGQ